MKRLVLMSVWLTACNLFTPSETDDPENATPNNAVVDMGASLDMPSVADLPATPDTAIADAGADMNSGPDGSLPDASVSTDFGWSRSGRVARGLLLYYTFEEGTGREVFDRAPRGGTSSLAMGPTATWIEGRNGVHVDGPERITGPFVGDEILNAVRPTEEITVEAWLKPDNLTQTGPARIVTFSDGSGVRNFTLGQAAAVYVLRFAVNDGEFDANGSPTLDAAPPVTLTETHVTFTYDGVMARIFVNGVLAGSSLRTGGLQSWDRTFEFLLGNEHNASRPWAGEIYKLAVYDRALTSPEVLRNYLTGSGP